jgi:hypothetical protein
MFSEERIQLEKLMEFALASAKVARECACGIGGYAGWERMPVSFPQERMHTVGTLVNDPYEEATFAEFHPSGTNYWSAAAPIAIRHFPYNRCTIRQCMDCGRCCLSYAESGGYYVEHRIRTLDPGLIVDAPL